MNSRLVRTLIAILAAGLMAFSSAANAFSAGVNGGGFLEIFGGALFDDYTITGSGNATATTLDFSWSLTTEGTGNLSAPVLLTGFDAMDFSGSGAGVRTFTFCDDSGTNEVCGSIPLLTAIAYDAVFVDDPLLFPGDTGLYSAEVANVGMDLLLYSESNFVTTNIVPVPAAAWLFASGLGLLGWMRRGRNVTPL